MLPNRVGRFKATILDHGVADTGPNKLATFVCQFQLTEELVVGEWKPVEEEFAITGYFYLEKRDGNLNTVTIDALKRAFGWDGCNPFWLQDSNFDGLVVQVKLIFDEYDGQTRIKVQWIDAESATPMGILRADDAMRRSISTRLGAKFRANAGGTAIPAPRPPAVSRPLSSATMEQAWEVFIKACPENSSHEYMDSEWFRLIGEFFGDKQPEQLTPSEWSRFAEEAPSRIVPF